MANTLESSTVDMTRAKEIHAQLGELIDGLDGTEIWPEGGKNNTAEEKARHRPLAQFSKIQQYASFLCRDLGNEIEAEYFRARGYKV